MIFRRGGYHLTGRFHDSHHPGPHQPCPLGLADQTYLGHLGHLEEDSDWSEKEEEYQADRLSQPLPQVLQCRGVIYQENFG